MDLLGNYSDDDSDNEEIVKQSSSSSLSSSLSSENTSKQLNKIIINNSTTTTTTTTNNNNNNSATNKGKKKKKKLDISFLPENIQAALARGDTAGDSDSDNEISIPQIAKSSLPTENTLGKNLLSKLPKPKDSNNNTELGGKSNKSIISITQNKNIENTQKNLSNNKSISIKDDDDVDSDIDVKFQENEDHSIFDTHANNNYSNSGENANRSNDDSDSDSVDDIGTINTPIVSNSYKSNPSILNSLSSSTTSTSTSTSSINYFPEPENKLPSFNYSSISTPSFQSTLYPSQYSTPNVSLNSNQLHTPLLNTNSIYQQQIPQQQQQQQNNYYDYSQQKYESQQNSNKNSSKSNNSRKRDRELESSLLRGDTSLLHPNIDDRNINSTNEQDGIKFIDVQHNDQWNSQYYYDQQKRQKELQTIFNFKQNGGDKMLTQPTKLQNRRHHINSLVMSAAESELELLEAKGRQMKTKYETQSKYGW